MPSSSQNSETLTEQKFNCETNSAFIT